MTTPLDLLKYHPERFKQSRPQLIALMSAYRSVSDHEGTIFSERIGKFQERITQVYNDEIADLPRDQRPRRPVLYVGRSLSMLAHYGKFVVNGRNIFDIDPVLIEMFRETDIKDVPLGLIQFIYRSFYIHFGKQSTMDLGDGNFCDGAYVSVHEPRGDQPGSLQILISTVRENVNYARSLKLVQDPEIYFYLALQFQQNTSFQQAFETFLKEEAEGRENRIKQGGTKTFEIDGEQITVEDVSPITATQEQLEMQQKLPKALPAIRAILNTLCFLGSRPDDVEASYPETAPTDLVSQTETVNYKKKRKAEQELARLGYLRIKFCGRRFSGIQANQPEQPEGSKSTKVDHPDFAPERKGRRGHWRLQPIGSTKAEERDKKLIWIMPTTTTIWVRIGQELQGRIYDVKPGTSDQTGVTTQVK